MARRISNQYLLPSSYTSSQGQGRQQFCSKHHGEKLYEACRTQGHNLTNSVVLTGAGLGKEFSLAVYDKLDRFGCRLYAFSKDDADKILNNQTGVLAQFRGRIARLKGFEVELLDESDTPISTEEQKATLPFLLTDSVIVNNVWAFHPTIMKYAGMYAFVPLYNESKTVTLPLRFELPDEFQEITAAVNAKLVFEDEFAEASLKTRAALHNTAINYLTKGVKVAQADFEAAASSEYPLAQIALDNIQANDELADTNALLDEVIDRLGELREKGNHLAYYLTAVRLELDLNNYENQKKCVPYLTQAAMVHPEAMIRMGEVYEQGFYDVKPNKKRADFYYKEGTRILSLLASQGLPSAAVELGHVYIEGLGTKQDTRRAENYFKFAEKAGYEDNEYWFWKHFGLSMRQVKIPEAMAKSSEEAWTILYLVREKRYISQIYHDFTNLNIGGANVSTPIVFYLLKERSKERSKRSSDGFCVRYYNNEYKQWQSDYYGAKD